MRPLMPVAAWDKHKARYPVPKQESINPGVKCRLVNVSGYNVQMGRVLGIEEPFPYQDDLSETDAAESLAHAPVYACGAVTWNTQRIAISCEPIADNETGVGYVAGHCLALVKVEDVAANLGSDELGSDDTPTKYHYAEWRAGEDVLFLSDGGYRLIWHSDPLEVNGYDHVWAIIDLSQRVGRVDYRVYNDSGVEIPAFSIVQVTGICSSTGAAGYSHYKVDKPDRDCREEILVVTSPIAAGSCGYASLEDKDGGLRLIVDTAGGTPAVGDIVGSKANSFKARKDSNGFVVLAVDETGSDCIVYVSPWHLYGDIERPWKDILDYQWCLWTPPERYQGVAFQAKLRTYDAIGSDDGEWVKMQFDSYGHLYKLNGGDPTPTETNTPTPTPTATQPPGTPTEGPTFDPPQSTCPSSVTVVIYDTTGDFVGAEGTYTKNLSIDNAEYCQYGGSDSTGVKAVKVLKVSAGINCSVTGVAGAIEVDMNALPEGSYGAYFKIGNKKYGTSYIGVVVETNGCWQAPAGTGTFKARISGWGA